MFSTSTETYVAWVTWLLMLGSGLAGLAGLLTLGGARRLRYFQVRREAVLRGWGRLVASVILLMAGLLVMGFGAPMMRLALPATPTRAPTVTPPASLVAPTITASPTLAETATTTDTPGPSPMPGDTPSPTISPTPLLPGAFITPIISATVTPPPQASAANVRFSLKNDCTVPDSQAYFDQLPKQIFAHFYYDSWLPGNQWSGVWLRDGVVVFTETHLWDGSTGGCGFSNFDNGKGWWSEGTYQVQIFVGSRWLVSNSFQILRASPSPTATPSRTERPPTATPTASDTHVPTDTQSPSPTRTATLGAGTPSVTAPPTATRTSQPSATTVPSRTPRPPTSTPSITPSVTATIYPPGVTGLATILLPSNITTGVLLAIPPDGPTVAFIHTGDPVEILTGYQMIDGVIWRQIRLANGDEGWIQLFMLKVIPPP
jgi:hypothetical protein